LIIRNRTPQMDPSAFPPGKDLEDSMNEMSGCSGLLIDATRKWDYPPVSLPKKEFMERARKLWERLELPKLQPQDPWYGYNLGSWSEEDEEEAELALKGEHYQTGEKAVRKRVPVKR
jgi:4-hydroxy-3-polyprenylbenzoate decarboxylase